MQHLSALIKTSLRVITIFQKIFQTTLPKSYKLPKIHVDKNNYYNHIKKIIIITLGFISKFKPLTFWQSDSCIQAS